MQRYVYICEILPLDETMNSVLERFDFELTTQVAMFS